MSIRNDITINWSVSPRIIEIAAPSTSISMQDLYDTVRNLASQYDAMDEDEIIDGAGKELLGDAVSVGLTIKLLNAKVKFEDRIDSPWIVCNIIGGNLVALDENNNSMDPVEPSSYVTTTRISSSSATIVETGVSGLTEEESNKLMNVALENSVQNIKQKTDSINWSDIAFIKAIQGGQWKVKNNQMIFYDEDNGTEIARFNLFNAEGEPAIENVTERQRVLC